MSRHREINPVHQGACPECDGEVPVSEAPRINQRICCPHCNSRLVVIGVKPIELDWAFAEPYVVRPHHDLDKRFGGAGEKAR